MHLCSLKVSYEKPENKKRSATATSDGVVYSRNLLADEIDSYIVGVRNFVIHMAHAACTHALLPTRRRRNQFAAQVCSKVFKLNKLCQNNNKITSILITDGCVRAWCARLYFVHKYLRPVCREQCL